MSRAQPRSSPTDEYARRIARAIAKGRPPPFTADLDRYCESSPREIFTTFAGAARHMPPAGNDEVLATGYLFLLQQQLEHLRYRTDRGYADAPKLIAEFQADVVARVEAGQVDGGMLVLLGGVLHQSKIPASTELAAASAQHVVDRNEDELVPTDVRAALAGILDACGGDPFTAVGSLIESGHAIRQKPEAPWPVLWPSPVCPKREPPPFCFCSIRIRMFAARLPQRLPRSPPR